MHTVKINVVVSYVGYVTWCANAILCKTKTSQTMLTSIALIFSLKWCFSPSMCTGEMGISAVMVLILGSCWWNISIFPFHSFHTSFIEIKCSLHIVASTTKQPCPEKHPPLYFFLVDPSIKRFSQSRDGTSVYNQSEFHPCGPFLVQVNQGCTSWQVEKHSPALPLLSQHQVL